MSPNGMMPSQWRLEHAVQPIASSASPWALPSTTL
jgi:hypothetical protein